MYIVHTYIYVYCIIKNMIGACLVGGEVARAKLVEVDHHQTVHLRPKNGSEI